MSQNTEIERKFLVKKLPNNLRDYPHKDFIQGYLCTSPVVRVRREGDEYVLTYKEGSSLCRSEYNLPLNKNAFEHLLKKCGGNIIHKTRYFIPLNSKKSLVAELDIFKQRFDGLILVEVEFASIKDAHSFTPPSWFGKDVSNDKNYYNSTLADMT